MSRGALSVPVASRTAPCVPHKKVVGRAQVLCSCLSQSALGSFSMHLVSLAPSTCLLICLSMGSPTPIPHTAVENEGVNPYEGAWPRIVPWSLSASLHPLQFVLFHYYAGSRLYPAKTGFWTETCLMLESHRYQAHSPHSKLVDSGH